jgi:hypothetical protein
LRRLASNTLAEAAFWIDSEEPASAAHDGAAIIPHGDNDMQALTQVARRDLGKR